MIDKIGRLLIIGFNGKDPDDSEVKSLARSIERGEIGGVILFKYNVESPKQLYKLTKFLKSIREDLIISADQEGGLVQRLSPNKGFTNTPSAFEVSNGNTVEEAYDIYKKTSSILADNFINLNFGPVVDLNGPCEIISSYKRSYSSDPLIVLNYARSFINAHKAMGVRTCLKHFPGHGMATGDTHKNLVDISDSFTNRELEPYIDLINDGLAESIMMAHVINRQLDETSTPSSMSRKIIQDILRVNLGFKNLIIADDLFMGAISKNYNSEEAISNSINAGCNMLIFSNNEILSSKDSNINISTNLAEELNCSILRLIEEGKIDLNILSDSFNKIDKFLNW